jgi:hypothetical protein
MSKFLQCSKVCNLFWPNLLTLRVHLSETTGNCRTSYHLKYILTEFTTLNTHLKWLPLEVTHIFNISAWLIITFQSVLSHSCIDWLFWFVTAAKQCWRRKKYSLLTLSLSLYTSVVISLGICLVWTVLPAKGSWELNLKFCMTLSQLSHMRVCKEWNSKVKISWLNLSPLCNIYVTVRPEIYHH